MEEEEEQEAARQREAEEMQTLALLASEQKERQLALDAQDFSCGLCLADDLKLDQMITLSCEPVGHRFCTECFQGYCKSKISEAQVSTSSLHCPSLGCKTPITIHEMKAHLSEEDFEKYERFTLRKVK